VPASGTGPVPPACDAAKDPPPPALKLFKKPLDPDEKFPRPVKFIEALFFAVPVKLTNDEAYVIDVTPEPLLMPWLA